MASSLDEDFETHKKFAEVQVQDPEKKGIQISISGMDHDKVTVSDSNDVVLSEALDFEKKDNLEFVIEVFDGQNTVKTPVKVKVNNINDLSASVNLSNEKVHEGSKLNTSVGFINLNDNSEHTFTLNGEDSTDFRISSTGEILVNETLSFEEKNTYNLSVSINGKNDSANIPLKIELSENLDPDFITTCLDSCVFKETASIGTKVIQATRTDNDKDETVYSLENDFS